jgi:hypothetical protein
VEMASLVRDSSERTGCRKKWATTTLGASYNGCGGEGKGGPDLGSAMRRRRIRGGGGWQSDAWRSSRGPDTGKGEAEAATCRRTEDACGGWGAWAVVAIVG